MHNYDFDILLRSVHCSAKLQIAKIHKNTQKQKFYPYKTSWEFEFSYKLYLAQNVQFCLSTPHMISPEPCKYTGWKCVNNIGDIRFDCSQKRNP